MTTIVNWQLQRTTVNCVETENDAKKITVTYNEL